MIGYTTKTTGSNLYGKDYMLSYSFCYEDFITRSYMSNNIEKLTELWKDSRAKVMCNAKHHITATQKYLNWDISNSIFHDVYILAHILRNDKTDYNLKNLALAYLDFFDNEPASILQLYNRLYPQISNNPKWKDIYEIELDLIRTTIAIEKRGVRLDKKRCEALIRELEIKLEQALNKIYTLCNKRISINKADEIRWLLYDYLKFPILTKTPRSGSPATDKETLLELRETTNYHPAIEYILQARSWSHGISILKGYIESADTDGIIHPCINTCGAKTGRESCFNPNLQNVSKTETLQNPYPIPARRVFRPRPGFVNFHLDYTGIEYKIGVHYSNDKALIDLINSGKDGHDMAASIFYGNQYIHNPDIEYKKMLRNTAKSGNFLILYGGSPKALSRTLKVSEEEGRRAYYDYKRYAPAYCNLNKTLMQKARDAGYVETCFGRRLYIPDSEAYIATNYLIQGTAAEILKRAQNRVHQYLLKATDGEAGIILPIHDELIIEYPREYLGEANHILKEVRRLMVNFPELKIPLEVEIEVATEDWSKKHSWGIIP